MTSTAEATTARDAKSVVALARTTNEGAHERRRPRTVGGLGVAIIALLLGVVAIAELYLLIQFWPETPGVGAIPPAAEDVSFFGITLAQQSRETLFFAVVMLSGALGGSVHALRSLAWYVGGQNFLRSWVLRYLYLPLVGALLATILYIIVRAGLLSGAAVDASSPYGFAALGALAGLFSDQGVSKLKQVFETLLTKPDEGLHGKTDTSEKATT